MKDLRNFHLALALISIMALMSLAALDRPVTATDVKRDLRNSGVTKTETILVYSTGTPHLALWNVEEGNTIYITAAEDDTWILGPGRERECNANGCPTFPNFGKFKYGALKGRFRAPRGNDLGAWFLVGTNYAVVARYSGKLYLACHDDFYDDNRAYISVKVELVR